MNFAIPVVGTATAARIMSLVDGLDDLKDVRQLTEVIKGPGKQNPT